MNFPLVRLVGSARERGLAQSRMCPETRGAVREAIRTRLSDARGQLEAPRMTALLAAQKVEAARLAPMVVEEIAGIAEGFGVSEDEVFDFLHLSVAGDVAATPIDADGCTAFAIDGIVGKNRDFRPEHAALQRVFVHEDPTWGGRSVLCVGSLGAPGPWSSGINSDGFALADTHVSTADHGPGIHRYFLMNRLLAECATVREAIALILSLPHCGGGNLVLADASGTTAAVELRHRRVDFSVGSWSARTNHFTGLPDPLSAVGHSLRRLETLMAAIAARKASPSAWLRIHEPEAICRHVEIHGGSPTLSASVYDTRARTAEIALGQPCTTPPQVFRIGSDGWEEVGLPVAETHGAAMH